MHDKVNTTNQELGFRWWTIWPWLGLTIGNLYILGAMNKFLSVALILVAVNTVLCFLILRFNKYAFLIATILSINPIIWIVNGIYLKNRWSHPKVNGAK